MNGKRHLYLFSAALLSAGAALLLLLALTPPSRAADDLLAAPAGGTLTPLGAGQPDDLQRRNAYEALWNALYYDDHPPLAWAATTVTLDGADYPPGAVLGDLDGYFLRVSAAAPFTLPRSFALHPRRVALFYSTVRDEYGQNIGWEEGDFEQLFRVYLWCEETSTGCPYFDTLTEAQIRSGGLADYDILILPTVRVGSVAEAVAALGDEGLAAIRDFVAAGGFLYAQADGAAIAEAAGLLPTGTVITDTRLIAAGNIAHLDLVLPDHPLAFSWLSPTAYILDEPLIAGTTGLTVVATFADTTHPGSVAVGFTGYGDGVVVLFNGHPSDGIAYHPQVLDALLWAMGERAGLYGDLCQQYSATVGCHTVPAYEPGVPIAVTTTFRNTWDGPLTDVVITETLSAGFTTALDSITPAPTALITDGEGNTLIIWTLAEAPPGDTRFTYIAHTAAPSGTAGTTSVSTAEAIYTDPFRVSGQRRRVDRNTLWVDSLMAARLVGDRDIELDGLYPLPGKGTYFDIALTLENKEETDARDLVITDVVVLLSPIVDVDDQRIIPHVLTDTWDGGAALSQTTWALNELFFYDTPVPLYPLPTRMDGLAGSAIVPGRFYTLTTWERGPRLVYTYTGHFTTTPGLTNSITIPPEYATYITLTPDGDLLLPALRLVWDFGDLPAYDYLEPATRYGLYSHELFHRTVSFASDPVTPSLVLEGFGGSVYTNLGGHPIPYHEYLSSGVVHIPIPPEMPRVAYRDAWGRAQAMELRTVFYDIVPFPPPEFHAVINTTFEMLADRDGDGRGETRVLEFPAREGAALVLYLKSWSNFHPDMPPLEKDENLIAQGMFRGRGFRLAPLGEDWAHSWRGLHLQGLLTDTDLITVVTEPAYDYLYFQQYLQSQRREGLLISATLSTYPGLHREGVMKIDDGARFVYHQKALGPSRYEVYDGHVQAVFGLSADTRVHKAVAPVLVATYDDHVYHFLRLSDPWDPRCFDWEPFIKSYGFGDLAATVYVGGRHGPELLWPRVSPGGRTQIRLEIRNNQTGITLTNLTITPTAPEGITVTLRSVTETEAIEPLFFDFPFLHRTTVPDGWRTVWYYDVAVSPAFTATGTVQEIGFLVGADGLPDYFRVPTAEVGIGTPDRCIETVWGQADDLRLSDLLPPDVAPEAARLANSAEATRLENALAVGDELSATAVFAGLRPVSFSTRTVSGGTLVSFTLPVSESYDATRMPWWENGHRSGTVYVILESHAELPGSGTAVINYGPTVTYTDDFAQVYTHTGNLQTVEVHGAALAVTYSVTAITDTLTGQPVTGVLAGVPNEVAVVVEIFNEGDYIAKQARVTITFDAAVTLLASSWPTAAQGTDRVTFEPPDIPPGGRRAVELRLLLAPAGEGRRRLIVHTDGRYVHEFPFAALTARQVVVEARLAGPLYLGTVPHTYRVFMPTVLRDYAVPWWPTAWTTP